MAASPWSLHPVGLAPEDRVGSASSLVSNGQGDAVLALPVEPGAVEPGAVEPGAVAAVLDAELAAIERRIAVGSPVVLVCARRQDQLAARDRLAEIAPPEWTVRL